MSSTGERIRAIAALESRLWLAVQRYLSRRLKVVVLHLEEFHSPTQGNLGSQVRWKFNWPHTRLSNCHVLCWPYNLSPTNLTHTLTTSWYKIYLRLCHCHQRNWNTIIFGDFHLSKIQIFVKYFLFEFQKIIFFCLEQNNFNTKSISC